VGLETQPITPQHFQPAEKTSNPNAQIPKNKHEHTKPETLQTTVTLKPLNTQEKKNSDQKYASQRNPDPNPSSIDKANFMNQTEAICTKLNH